MKGFKFTLIAGMAGLAFSAQAQHSCGTDEYYQKCLATHPEVAEAEKAYNEQSVAYAGQPHNRATKYIIPVVFHVIHTNGPENISRDQILDQLRVLNADYSYTNANKTNIRSQFLGVAADAQIEFRLAKIDPNGNCTEGINRVYSPLGVEVDQTTEEVKKLIQWPYQKYLNIWVVSSIKSDQVNGTILGYAQFPWMPDKTRDGIVVRADHVGTIGYVDASDSGRTLSHEIGHWLGLYHTFQGGCNSQDFCDDTPPVFSSTTNANCPANGNSCSTDSPDLPDQWENYMDYSRGACMAMFTLNQKTRMHSYLAQAPRSTNVSSTNLLATGVTLSSGAPLANFTSSQTTVCAGKAVTFYDISCKATVTARSWSLPGSSIPSSSDVNPTVVYQTPGKYKVTLLVQNSSGNNTKVVDNYITVVDPNAKGVPNFEEDFELSNPESRGFTPFSPHRWQWVGTTGHTGTGSFKAPVTSSDTPGTIFSFITPAVNLASMEFSALKFTFYASYAPSSTTSSETLRVYVSTDCGNSYRQLLERSGTGLAYSGATVTNNFVPSSSNQWKLMGITSLSALGLTSYTHAIFRIDVVSAKGNPVYIDNLNISPYFAGIDPAQGNNPVLQLYPNPTNGKLNIEFNNALAGNTFVGVYDNAGRLVKEVYNGVAEPGFMKLECNLPSSAAPSLYFIKLVTPQGQIAKPITFVP